MKPKYFKYNGLGGEAESVTEQMGVIAQDVEKVAPGLVSLKQVKLYPEDREETAVKVVNYSGFIYAVINSIQELYGKWSSDSQVLHHQISQLKAENTQLKEYLCIKDPEASFCI